MSVETIDRDRIRDAIIEAESRTSGEIFCVVARASDDYAAFPILWAGLGALSLPLALIPLTGWPAAPVYTAQLALFLVLGLGLSLPPLRYVIVPPHIKRLRARRNAMDQFLAHGLHTTRERTGVLLFVSLAEHHAEVVADEAIDGKVDRQVWDEAVNHLVAGAKSGDLGSGFVNAIVHVGAVLAAHFPPNPADDNELPDHLVIL